jgi:cobalt/nickel transport system permease protein
MVAAALILTARPLEEPAYLVVTAHIPVIVVEGILAAVVVSFLKKTKPEMLGASNAKFPDAA